MHHGWPTKAREKPFQANVDAHIKAIAEQQRQTPTAGEEGSGTEAEETPCIQMDTEEEETAQAAGKTKEEK